MELFSWSSSVILNHMCGDSKQKMVLRNVVRSSIVSGTPVAFFTVASERGCFSFGWNMQLGFFRLPLVFMFLPSTVELASLCLFFACFARDTRPKLFVCPNTRLEGGQTMKKNDILTATYRTYCVAAQCDKLIWHRQERSLPVPGVLHDTYSMCTWYSKYEYVPVQVH